MCLGSGAYLALYLAKKGGGVSRFRSYLAFFLLVLTSEFHGCTCREVSSRVMRNVSLIPHLCCGRCALQKRPIATRIAAELTDRKAIIAIYKVPLRSPSRIQRPALAAYTSSLSE
jgi:hypothetical protein